MYFGSCDRMNLLLTPPTMNEDEEFAKRRKVHTNDREDEREANGLLESYTSFSSLPTPPLLEDESQPVLLTDSDLKESNMVLRGSAQYLSGLVRSREKGVPVMKPDFIEGMLMRANLDSQTVAFAACILYRLSWRFVRDWKNEMISRQGPSISDPEVIVLAALYVASSWLDDRPRSVRFWVQDVGYTTKAAFLASQFCILNDPSTNLMHIDFEEVQGMEEDLAAEASCDLQLEPEFISTAF